MSLCCKYLFLYLLLVPIHIGLLIGVALLTEMMIAVQMFLMCSVAFLSYAWKVNFSWRDMGCYISLGLICYFLAVYIAICGSLVAANGTNFTLGGWLSSISIVSLLLCYNMLPLPKSEKKYRIWSTLVSAGLLSLFVCLILFIFETKTVSPFSKAEHAFDPYTINEHTLNARRGIDTISYSRCGAPACNRFIFDTQYSIRSVRSLPAGFILEPQLESVRSVRLKYNGNTTLDYNCESYEVFVKCSAVYEASIGLVWIGKECPTTLDDPLSLPCVPIDTSTASFSFWFGVISIFYYGYLLWSYFKMTLKEEEVEEQEEEEQQAQGDVEMADDLTTANNSDQ